MPIDIASFLSNSVNKIATESRIGYVLGHPVWTAIIIVGVILLIFTAWDVPNIGFKFAMYLTISILSILTVHDSMLTSRYRSRTDVAEQNSMIRPIIGGGVTPRTLGEIRPAVVAAPPPAAFVTLPAADNKSDIDLLLNL